MICAGQHPKWLHSRGVDVTLGARSLSTPTLCSHFPFQPADGQPGITALAFDSMLVEDMKPGEDGTPEHIAVPYGVMTGMRDQLT